MTELKFGESIQEALKDKEDKESEDYLYDLFMFVFIILVFYIILKDIIIKIKDSNFGFNFFIELITGLIATYYGYNLLNKLKSEDKKKDEN